MEEKIPKIIHYCWFGGNPLPELAKKCIHSWKIYCPEYEIKEWNEHNFDINCCDYVREAYAAKKWAFVSDYVRFWVLYQEGGLYFDTDVEVIKSLDDIIEKGAFMGCEKNEDKNGNLAIAVNPGLGFGCEPKNQFLEKMLNKYQRMHFRLDDGTYDLTTIVSHTTEELIQRGLNNDFAVQKIDNLHIYPPEYFCPVDYKTGKINITVNTKTIHHYSESWHSVTEKWIRKLERMCSKFDKSGDIMGKIIVAPLRVIDKIEKYGVRRTIDYYLKKFIR